MYLIALLYSLSALYFVDCYKILVIYPFPVRSICLLGESVVKNLLRDGHEVTYMTVFPMKSNNPKLKQIDISKNLHLMMDIGGDLLNISKVMRNEVHFENAADYQNMAVSFAEASLSYDNVQEFMADTSAHYDAVISDFLETEVYAGFAALFDCPMMWFYSLGAHSPALRLVDDIVNPAHSSSEYTSSNVSPFTFKQRVEELWKLLQYEYTKRFITSPKEEAIYEKYFGPYFEMRGKKLTNYYDLVYNASIIFSNDYHTFGNVPSTPQNFIFIGGQHIEKPAKPLPKDLQSLMDNAKYGVIYFSLGSTWKSKDMPKDLVDGLLKMFGELKQTVIWKFEEDLENIPSNVHTVKWAPQHSVLDHPNLLFFISHGGLLSTTEAIHFAVPVIGVPVFVDQFLNIKKAVSKGYALQVPLSPSLPVDLKKAVDTMLGDKRYKERVKEVSFIYHDRPTSAVSELVHWVNHVIRTRGAPHLRSPALMLPWYQKVYLDLIALIILALAVIVKLIKVLMRMMIRERKESGKIKKKIN